MILLQTKELTSKMEIFAGKLEEVAGQLEEVELRTKTTSKDVLQQKIDRASYILRLQDVPLEED